MKERGNSVKFPGKKNDDEEEMMLMVRMLRKKKSERFKEQWSLVDRSFVWMKILLRGRN